MLNFIEIKKQQNLTHNAKEFVDQNFNMETNVKQILNYIKIMQTIAVLLTVFNRKDKTLECLKRLYAQLPIESIE